MWPTVRSEAFLDNAVLNMKHGNLLRVVGAGLVCASLLLTLAERTLAREYSPPKLNLSDRDLDRSVHGVSYSTVIKRVTPSVVTIQSTRTIESRMPGWQQFFDDPMFRQFFGDRFRQRDRSGRPRRYTQEGLGSGVIVSEDGYILTNNHVVEGADADGVKVAFADGKTEYDAKVVGRDRRTDIAVLKIEAKKLPAITLADSDKLEVGDVVLAIGNPFGIGQSVSMGIVSALGRGLGILGAEGYEDFIQTDAPINPGNSGGALVDAEGRLVGINQSIISGGGMANAGVGFAVPVNLARSVMDRLVTEGKVARGYLGVDIQPVSAELAKEFHLPDDSGAFIAGVRPDSPAADAGLRERDVIIELNGKKVPDSRHLRLMVSQTAPKTKVTMKIIRDAREKTITATLGTLPDELGGTGEGSEDQSGMSKSDALDGVEVGDLDAQSRRQYNIPSHVRGALVTKVDADSPAGEAGLHEGDVILEINRQAVRDADEAVRLSEKAKEKRVWLRTWSGSSGGGFRYFSVEEPKRK